MTSLGNISFVVSSETEIGNLKDTLVVDEQVGSFHVSVQNAAVVEISQAFEQLEHVALDLRLLEMDRGVIEKTGKIVIHIGSGHVYDGLFALIG